MNIDILFKYIGHRKALRAYHDFVLENANSTDDDLVQKPKSSIGEESNVDADADARRRRRVGKKKKKQEI